jgi:NhaP-type Na+/H+ or K+/H+ antiporter
LGLGLYRAFEEVHSSTSVHSTVFILNSAKQLFGGVLVSLIVFYMFNKFRARLLSSKFLFGVMVVVVCFYVCEVYLQVNGLIAVTILGIVLVVRYKSGTGERYNRRLVDLTSSYIIVVACLMLGYMDYQN